MKLTKVILVNWFLYQPIEISFYGNTAIIGENGAGKSTIIDAIQTVLFGGNQKYIKLNASSAESRSDRDIKSYCLGYFRPDDGSNNPRNFRKRDECLSYICLVFHNDLTNTFVNIFIGMEVRGDEKKVDFKLRGMVECQRSFIKEDFITLETDGSYQVLGFDLVKQRLSISGIEPHYEQNSIKFLHEMVHMIGPKEVSQWIDPNTLRDALSKSISLKEVKDISKFVENFILEPKNIDIRSLVNAKNRYEEIENQIKACEQQVEDLSSIQKYSQSYEKQIKRSNHLNWLMQQKKIDEYNQTMDQLDEKIQKEVETFTDACRQLRTLQSQLPTFKAHQAELLRQIQQDDVAQQEKQLQNDINNLTTAHKHNTQKLSKIYQCLKGLCSLDIDTIQDTTFIQWVKALTPLLDQATANGHLDDLISKITERSPVIQELLKKQKEVVYGDLTTAKRHIEQYQGYIQSANNGGKTPLTPATEGLIQHLAEYDIKAEPICHITECLDITWQPAIEAFLGKEIEALIIPIHQEKQAIKIYRQYKKEHNLFGSTIVKVSKAQDWLNQFNPNTAATLVDSENELALAYLHKRLGHLELVDSEEALKQSNFAITKDGMTATTTGISSKKLSHHLRMVKDQTDNIRLWQKERHTHDDLRRSLEIKRDTLERIDHQISAIDIHQKEMGSLLTHDIFVKITECEQTIHHLTERLHSLDFGHLEALQKEADIVDKHISATIETIGVHKQRKELRLIIARTLKSESQQLEIKVDSLIHAQQQIEQDPFFDAQYNDEFQQEQSDISLEKLTENIKNSDITANSKLSDAEHAITAYASKHTDFETTEVLPLSKHNLMQVITTIKNHIDTIQEMSLIPYRSDAEKARENIGETFRVDVINRLKEAFDFQNQQFSALNKALANKEFHSEIYRFTKKSKNEFKLLIDYISNTSPELLSTSSLDLFDQMPTDVKSQIDLLVEFDQQKESDIQDYRKYFTYDVTVINQQTGNQTKLSNLLKTGSGGEKQSPFYVAIAASLANAWRTLNNQGKSAGLALLDEAFNKLDATNLQNAINFMNDTGLQVIVATPASNENVFKEAVDCTIYISKYSVGNTMEVDVDIEILTDKAKQLLIQENPIHQSFKL